MGGRGMPPVHSTPARCAHHGRPRTQGPQPVEGAIDLDEVALQQILHLLLRFCIRLRIQLRLRAGGPPCSGARPGLSTGGAGTQHCVHDAHTQELSAARREQPPRRCLSDARQTGATCGWGARAHRTTRSAAAAGRWGCCRRPSARPSATAAVTGRCCWPSLRAGRSR